METDETLMVLYQSGEYGAFEELYRRHAGKVYGYLKKKLPAAADADDLLQLVFLKLHQSRARYDASLPVLPWLYTITRHAIIDEVRRKKATPVDAEKFDVAAEAAEDAGPSMEAILAIVPENERELLRLRFEEGLSFDDLSRRLGVAPPSLRKRVSRTIRTLRKALGGHDDE